MAKQLPRPDESTRLTQEYFSQDSGIIAVDLLGRTIVRQFPDELEIVARIKEVAAFQGAAKSSSETVRYSPGIIGISRRFGNCLMDIGTLAERRASCVTLVALETPRGTIQGPGNVARYLKLDESFNSIPIDGTSLWIGGEPITSKDILKRSLTNRPKNCRGYFYYR